jgi:DNA-binding beta-propeller fold protein YncE
MLAASALVAISGAAAYLAMTGSQPPVAGPHGESRIAARIRVPGPAFRIAAGAGSVWVLVRGPSPSLARIDPHTNRVVEPRTSLPIEPWDLTVGADAVWIAPNGAEGQLLRVDARTGRITRQVTAHPIYFGSEVVLGHGHLWTGNDDERYKAGRTVTKVDPDTGRVVGRPLVLGSPQSLAAGPDAVWDADHSGWIVKIDPVSVTVATRRRLDFAPHGVVVGKRAVYVADAHGSRLVEVDPETARIRRSARLPVPPIFPAIGGGSIWTGSAKVWDGGGDDDRVARIDPESLALQETVHAGGSVSSVTFAFGSLWAALQTGEVVRITPAG